MCSYDFILGTGRTKAKDYMFCRLNFLQLWQNRPETFTYMCCSCHVVLLFFNFCGLAQGCCSGAPVGCDFGCERMGPALMISRNKKEAGHREAREDDGTK